MRWSSRPARQQRVILGHVRIRVNGDRGNMQLAAPRPLIERLNIFQAMIEAVTTEVDFILRHRIEHERVIRVGGMTQGKDFSALHFHLFRCLLIIRLPRRLLAKTFGVAWTKGRMIDRKSTRLNSSDLETSYAVFCLKKKTRS